MKIVSTNYTGVIPGIGKGPFTNKQISDQLYNSIRNLGYPVTITSVKAKPKVVVQNVSQKVEKKPVTKVDEAVKTAEKIATETAKPVESVEEKPVVQEEVEAAPVTEPKTEAPAEATLENTEVVPYTKEYLEGLEVEELDKILSADVKRPIRYGKPWLIKQILAQAAQA